MFKERITIIFSHICETLWDGLFWYGFGVVLYGYFGYYLKINWDFLDKGLIIANYSFTCLSVLVTCFSIYLKGTNTPSTLSIYCSSPLVIIFVICVIAESLVQKRIPNNSIQTGLAMMGMSGALHQIVPRVHKVK